MKKIEVLALRLSRDVAHAYSQSEVRLPPWSEVVGIYHGLRDEGPFTFIIIGGRSVVFPKDSMEAELARKQLNRKLLKRKIGMLRTDPNKGHLLVRVMEK